MRNRKGLILSFAFLVGVGLMGSAEEVDAAANTIAVAITSPDSGSTLGIDGAFVATATVTHLASLVPNADLTVTMYLATTDSTVLTDTTNNAATFRGLDFVAGATQSSVVLAVSGKTALVAADGGATTALVAVQQKRSGASTAHVGDGDSVVVDASVTTQTVFTWYGKLHASSGTVASGIKVFARASDSLSVGLDTTASASSVQALGVDGDRPANPQSFIDKDGNNISNDVGVVDIADAQGEILVKTFAGIATNDHYVLNIGDTLTVRSKLGAQFLPLLKDTKSKLVVSVHGKEHLVHQSGMKTASSNGDTMAYDLVLTEGQYGDLNAAAAIGNTDTIQFHIVDPAGNLSSVDKDNVIAEGMSAATALLFDTAKPVLDGAAGDTLLPAAGDNISDGTANTDFLDDGAGNNPDDLVTWNLKEALSQLVIDFGAKDTVTVANTSLLLNHASLQAGATRYLDFTALGSSGTRNALVLDEVSSDRDTISTTAGTGSFDAGAAVGDSIVTGLYDFTFTPTDVSGNAGAAVTRAGVYVDFDNMVLGRLFPTKGAFGPPGDARLDTLNASTAKVVFALSEPADSVNITYKGYAGAAKDSLRTKTLSGIELTKLTQQSFPIALIDSSSYRLVIRSRDLAGNWTQTLADSFFYASDFQELSVQNFAIAAAKSGLKTADHLLAGQVNELTITAKALGNKDAVTYDKDAVITIAGGRGVTLTGSGVEADTTSAGAAISGQWVLKGAEWVLGTRKATLKNTTARDTLVVSLIDTATQDTAGVAVQGKLTSPIVYDPEVYSKIWVGGADGGLTEGVPAWVDVVLQDKFGNARDQDTRNVEITTNKPMVELPTGAIQIKDGKGGFWFKSGWVGDGLVLWARDIVKIDVDSTYPANSDDLGKDFITGASPTWAVSPAGMMALAEPDTLIVQDYKGANGGGDQGGFVMVTHPNVEGAEGYWYYREVVVTYGVDDTGMPVKLETNPDGIPHTRMVMWGGAPHDAGADLQRSVIATLDADTTAWGVVAHGDGGDMKRAFESGTEIADPYELMSETVVESRKAALADPNIPRFVTLTPEALAFIDKGIVPRMKSTTISDVPQSEMVYSAEAVRATDDIPPEPVSLLQVFDTPNDVGGSITVTWIKSESDYMMPRNFAGAVGPSISDVTPGVKGYNIYRKVGEGESSLVGKASSGETSFVDIAAFNGVHYTYTVNPYDEDNITELSPAKTALAVRNRVFDSAGAPIFGLFGADNQVGFDDFFLFADKFGMQAGDEGFDLAFDLSPNNRVDFNDFFLFADNFTRIAIGSAKVVPMTAGLNNDARLDLYAVDSMPRVGEETVLNVNLADFAELRGYGFTVSFDPDKFEFVRTVADNDLMSGTDLAQPQVLAKSDGEVSIAAFGETLAEGELGVSLVFRSIAETEQSLIELTRGQLSDANYALNQVVSLGAVQLETRPEVYALGDNYPNPFNPETTIKYQLPDAVDVRLDIYNVVGQVVRTLVADNQTAGRYIVQWDATDDSGQDLSSGIYFYRLQAGEFQEVSKMLLLK